MQLLLHEVSTVVTFCEEQIVLATSESKVVGCRIASTRERRVVMIHFQEVPSGAASTVVAHEGALPRIACMHLTQNPPWNVARA
jgi:hypothetical protein